ncbi:MAG: DUF362 domain-containing protein [Lachnospiraceae bacterium]|nr:DUF362 domain-containing protein [Lachnospiraceae bacterium]
MEKNEIYRMYGKEYKEMTKTLLNEANMASLIPEGARIGIKPNLVEPVPADFGATTHPEVVAGIIEYLQENGKKNIKIIEGSWIGDKTEEAFEYCGYNTLSSNYGVELVDTQKESFFEAGEGELKVKVVKCLQDVDFLINVPVLKGHCQTNITCALKNMKGLITNAEKRRFHTLGLHEPIAILNSVIKQDFIVVDHICGDLVSEGGGNPVSTDCVLVGRDPVLMDSYFCKLMGYELEDVPYIKLSEAKGVGSSDLSSLVMRTVGGDGVEREEVLPKSHKLLNLKDKAEDVNTCSACYESLMEAMMRLEDEGYLEGFEEKICIGQGYRGKTGELGVGNCTRLFNYSIKGCPPDPEDVYQGLRDYIDQGRKES